MRLPIIKIITIIPFFLLALSSAFLFGVKTASAEELVHGMSPREGYVKTATGAPVSNIKVIEFSDWCPPRWPDENDPSYANANCKVPQNCHIERSEVTDENGHYYFAPYTPEVLPADPCNINAWWMYTCWNTQVSVKAVPNTPQQASLIKLVETASADEASCPPVPHQTDNFTKSIDTPISCNPPAACNVMCKRDGDCAAAGVKDGCTSCLGGVCRPPQACNIACTDPTSCQFAKDGCTSCLPSDTGSGNVCRPNAACNVACTKDGQCTGAKDGCTACVNGSCKIPPACGVACTSKAECSGAKDGCSECLEGTCTNYNDNMCKCDGLVADMAYPGNAFKFEAFGKVEGADVKKAEIADITFRMTKDNQVIAKSDPIKPEIVENSATKSRFKAAWQTTPPAADKNATYLVFADVRCKPKKVVASNGELANATVVNEPTQAVDLVTKLSPPKGLQLIADVVNKLFGKGSDLITKEALAQLSSPSPKAENNLQLKNLNFIKMMDTDNCRFVMWKFDETLF